MTSTKYLFVFLMAILATSVTRAELVRITIRNESPGGGIALAPFAVAAHDGSYDPFDTGVAASQAIESLAELGDGSQLLSNIVSAHPAAVTDTVVATQGGFGPGIFRPGASGSVVLDVDPAVHRYLTFGSMVLPSNDAFLGNESPTFVGLFDTTGNFIATDFTLTGSDIWDAGTEVNQLFGAAYVVGQDATLGDDEGLTVTMADLATEFAPYLGSMTPAGEVFSTSPLGATPVARFEFEAVPEPGSLVLATVSMFLLAALGYRRRRTTAK